MQTVGEFNDSPISQRKIMVRPWALDRKPTARLLPSLADPTPEQRPGSTGNMTLINNGDRDALPDRMPKERTLPIACNINVRTCAHTRHARIHRLATRCNQGPLVNTPKKGNSGARVDPSLKHLLQEQYRNDCECNRLRTHSAQGTLVKPQAEHARPKAR